MTTLLVVNPYCRDGDNDCKEIVEALTQTGRVVTHRLDARESLRSQIKRVGSGLRRIVIAGGDGTLNRALPQVLKAGVPLGVVPLGTANDFARSLQLPPDPVDAATVIANGCKRRVDVGVVNGRPFLNAVGVGLGPELTKKMDKEKKKRLGVLAYLESLVQVLGQPRRRYATLKVDGQPESTPFMQITIANGRHYGGGLMVSDEVEMDDGLLHTLCVKPLTPSQLFLRGLRIRFGAVSDDEKLIYRKGMIMEVQTRWPCDVTADGELIGKTPIECRTLPSALEVYSPREQIEADSAEPEYADPVVDLAAYRAAR